MPRKISKYVKYTPDELENYKNAEGSCVKKMNAKLHLNILPFGLRDFKQSLLKLLLTKKVGLYDEDLEGIILDIHNVKLIDTSGAIRFDDPRIHLDVVCDCYIFKPIIGAIVQGTVRHVSSSQIGVIIYRVFSVSIRLTNKPSIRLQVDSEIEFRIKEFNLEHMYPYIEGELVNTSNLENNIKSEEDDKEEIKNVIALIDEIKKDELNDEAIPTSPPKAKKRKSGVTIKTEK